MSYIPRYHKALKSGELRQKVQEAYAILSSCRLCPRYCGINRTEGKKGFCKVGDKPIYSSYGPHFGEESPLVGTRGSGTIFMTGCNLGCIFCQNYDISHMMRGKITDVEEIAAIMLTLQSKGCHNINFVTPTHQMPFLLAALEIAAAGGLNIPIVWNCGGYESHESLEILDGVIDIYMPDAKFWNADVTEVCANAPDYPEIMKAALKEMFRQVGDLVIENGIAIKGLLIRHLVLPGNLGGSREIFKFIAEEISPNTYVNVMSQYRPHHRAEEYQGLDRALGASEYKKALEEAKKAGLKRLDQEIAPRTRFLFEI